MHGLRVDDIVWDCPFVHGRIVAYPSEKIYCNLQAQSKDKDDAVKRQGELVRVTCVMEYARMLLVVRPRLPEDDRSRAWPYTKEQ